jgi:hypothetical protein
MEVSRELLSELLEVSVRDTVRSEHGAAKPVTVK